MARARGMGFVPYLFSSDHAKCCSPGHYRSSSRIRWHDKLVQVLRCRGRVVWLDKRSWVLPGDLETVLHQGLSVRFPLSILPDAALQPWTDRSSTLDGEVRDCPSKSSRRVAWCDDTEAYPRWSWRQCTSWTTSSRCQRATSYWSSTSMARGTWWSPSTSWWNTTSSSRHWDSLENCKESENQSVPNIGQPLGLNGFGHGRPEWVTEGGDSHEPDLTERYRVDRSYTPAAAGIPHHTIPCSEVQPWESQLGTQVRPKVIHIHFIWWVGPARRPPGPRRVHRWRGLPGRAWGSLLGVWRGTVLLDISYFRRYPKIFPKEPRGTP